jgi:predicted HAD superfamily Cof-like phosphohydrolase
MTNNTLGIRKWHKDRNLTTFNKYNESLLILEEVFELLFGIESIEASALAVTTIGNILKQRDLTKETLPEQSMEKTIDAFSDILYLVNGALLKLGIDPDLALTEVVAQNETRAGQIGANGKFIKHTTKEYTDKWYKPDFDKCKLNPLAK